jgi:hypothetical protein
MEVFILHPEVRSEWYLEGEVRTERSERRVREVMVIIGDERGREKREREGEKGEREKGEREKGEREKGREKKREREEGEGERKTYIM